MLKCPICGTDRILGEEEKFYCYDFEYEEVRPFNGVVIPHLRYHRVHGPFPSLERLASGTNLELNPDGVLVYSPSNDNKNP